MRRRIEIKNEDQEYRSQLEMNQRNGQNGDQI
jgi:hypothetical protein